jgi:hypothetical protein
MDWGKWHIRFKKKKIKNKKIIKIVLLTAYLWFMGRIFTQFIHDTEPLHL